MVIFTISKSILHVEDFVRVVDRVRIDVVRGLRRIQTRPTLFVFALKGILFSFDFDGDRAPGDVSVCCAPGMAGVGKGLRRSRDRCFWFFWLLCDYSCRARPADLKKSKVVKPLLKWKSYRFI